MRRSFLRYLSDEGVLDPVRAARIIKSLRAAPEPIGAIAFRYGLITGTDIDEILDRQRTVHRQFGEIAIEMGLLTGEQVRTLLIVQQTRGVVETAEALALAGVCSYEEIAEHLGRFLAIASKQTVCNA